VTQIKNITISLKELADNLRAWLQDNYLCGFEILFENSDGTFEFPKTDAIDWAGGRDPDPFMRY
jgi:hypothetical protein